MTKMCEMNHRELTSSVFANLVSKGGGIKVAQCEKCGKRFLVSYDGPVGLFATIRELDADDFAVEHAMVE